MIIQLHYLFSIALKCMSWGKRHQLSSNTNTSEMESTAMTGKGIKDIPNCNLDESAFVQLEPSLTANVFPDELVISVEDEDYTIDSEVKKLWSIS